MSLSAAPPAPARAALGAVLLLLLGVFLLTFMGAQIKLLGGRFASTELAAWRNLFGMIPTAVILAMARDWRARGRPLKLRRWKLALMRGVFVTFAQLAYYLALVSLEFATASTLLFAGPMFVTALSAVLLGSPVGPWRWGAVVAGFAGCAMILRPGTDAFALAALLPLCAAFGYALTSTTSKLIDAEAPTALINLYSSCSALVGAVILALATGGFTQPESLAELGLLLGMGASGGTGVVCLIAAYRLTTPAVVAPFEYFGLLFAIALGWAMFGEAPFDTLLPGAPVIVAAGLVIAWRERRRSA